MGTDSVPGGWGGVNASWKILVAAGLGCVVSSAPPGTPEQRASPSGSMWMKAAAMTSPMPNQEQHKLLRPFVYELSQAEKWRASSAPLSVHR